jgi:hypothetical protein
MCSRRFARMARCHGQVIDTFYFRILHSAFDRQISHAFSNEKRRTRLTDNLVIPQSVRQLFSYRSSLVSD